MTGFTKLHSTILDSSIWDEDHATRIVWITLLAMSDASGNVIASQRRQQSSANVSKAEYDKAIEILAGPDPQSKSPEHEGRRILPITGGWHLITYAKHRSKRDPEKRREQNRQAKRRQRKRGQNQNSQRSGQPPSAQAEAEAEGHNSIEFRLSLVLFDLIRSRKADYKKPNLQVWAKHIDRMIRLDTRIPERIEAVIQWCQADPFWQNNILSTEKLRKQFDRLELQMINRRGKQNGPTHSRHLEEQQSEYGESIESAEGM